MSGALRPIHLRHTVVEQHQLVVGGVRLLVADFLKVFLHQLRRIAAIICVVATALQNRVQLELAPKELNVEDLVVDAQDPRLLVLFADRARTNYRLVQIDDFLLVAHHVEHALIEQQLIV